MKQVSVVIPTYKRPGLLRNALRSVQEQTAFSLIFEVVVVENGGQRESESVCNEFPTLPIRYIFRDPPLLPEHSGRDLYEKPQGMLVAVLFDDDWWDRSHLEWSVHALERYPSASAYYCPAFSVKSESDWLKDVKGSFIPWFACSTPLVDGLRLLSLSDMVIASLFGTGFYSPCLVARNAHLSKCLAVFDYGNPYDTDRMLSLELAKRGTIICDRTPGVFFRLHAGSETSRIHKEGIAERWFDDSTRRILAFAAEAGIDIEKEFRQRVSITRVTMRQLIHSSDHKNIEYLAGNGLLGHEIQRCLLSENRKNLVRTWVPPGILGIGQGIRRLLYRTRQA